MSIARLTLLCCVLCVTLLAGCRTAPVTGRKQLSFMSESREVAMGLSAYQDVVTKEPASTNPQYLTLVNRVGQRIAAVSGRPDYQWEFRVLASPQQNAFCLPGGKVAVYEGIIPICQTEAGLAVVMSHEIGHALARHGGERISENYAVESGRLLMGAVTQSFDQRQQEMMQKFYGVGTNYGYILPHSRTHELEADHIGLILMAQAGYDPREAPAFWQRFAASHNGAQPAEWQSTHPNDEHRAQALAALLPQAIQLYEAAPQKLGQGEVIAVASPPANGPAAVIGQAPKTHAMPAAANTNGPAQSFGNSANASSPATGPVASPWAPPIRQFQR